MSIVAGPPPIHSMIAALCFFFRSVELAAKASVTASMAGNGQRRGAGQMLHEVPTVHTAGGLEELMVAILVAKLGYGQ